MYHFYLWGFFITFIVLGSYIGQCSLFKRKPNLKWFLFISITIFGFVIYLYGYIQYFNATESTEYIQSALRAVYSVFRMYFINDDFGVISSNSVSNGSELLSPTFMIPFWICHIMAPITTTLAVLSIFGKQIRDTMRIILGFKKDRYIIFGVNTKSLCLAQNIMTGDDGKSTINHKRLIVFIDESADNIYKEKIEKIGGVLLDEPIFKGDDINVKALYMVGINKFTFLRNIYIFAFSESDIANSVIVSSILNHLITMKISSNNLKGIFIHTDSDIIIDDLEEKYDKLKLEKKYNLNYFCEEELAARKLFIEKPLYHCLKFDNKTGLPLPKDGFGTPTITIMILGFGVCGRHILRKAIMNGQFKGSKLHIIIFDKRMDILKGEFINRYPGCIEKQAVNNEIEFVSEDICSSYFYNKLEDLMISKNDKSICKIDFVVSCLGNDHKNLEIMSDIKRYLTRLNCSDFPEMIAHIADNKYQLFNSGENKLNKISIFGNYDNIFTHEIIVNQEMDKLAQMVDSITYNGTNWNGISVHEKNSNRAVAAFLGAYFHIMGFELINGERKNMLEKCKIEFFEAEKNDLVNETNENEKYELLVNIASTEHLRWNAFHFANGWVVKPLNQITDETSRKDPLKKTHGCLVTWDELENVAIKVKNDKDAYRAYDKLIVKRAYDIIQAYNSLANVAEQDKLYIIRRIDK